MTNDQDFDSAVSLAKTRLEIMVRHVKNHALAHYEEGWDIVIETMTDAEIAAEIANCTTLKGAIRKMVSSVILGEF